ncbi:hypothetical protein DPEC_G00268890 [Dallia pectoralis]|uniref:Uncharacterized protein n=1 Tax=Dallia pectoralis TaxID=75939 RepID=A0ACC2FNZ8_DALPE|nr:hypothetical protein DPEC_G00268890 [Dallia pectoralis]
MTSSLICSETQSRVSSVLHRDVKQFGKKYMFDSNEESCWNSDQGDCQWVTLEFPQPIRVSQLKVQFQGGFSGQTCRLEGSLKDEDMVKITDFYPEDNSSLQISFTLFNSCTGGRCRPTEEDGAKMALKNMTATQQELLCR